MTLYQCELVNNACYSGSYERTPTGIVVHSTGANNTFLSRYVQPASGQSEGMSEGIVGITELSNENDARVKELVSQAELDILQGRQKVFTGVIETNDGGTVGTAGQDFSDGDITGNLHWYFKNVVIVP